MAYTFLEIYHLDFEMKLRMSIKLTLKERATLKRLAKHHKCTMTDILSQGIALMETMRKAEPLASYLTLGHDS